MIPTELYEDVLDAFPALRGLPPDLDAVLRREALPLRFPAGMVAFEEGSTCSAFPLLTKGRIRVAMPAPNGREIALYRVDPGDACVLNLHCLIEGVHLEARGITSKDCEGILIPQAVFNRLVNEAESFRLWVLRDLSGRVLGLMGLVSEVAFHHLDTRLARRLVALAAERPDATVPCTHQNLADDLGSVREIVSRILGSFADQGFLLLERGRVRVLDVEALRRFAEGE